MFSAMVARRCSLSSNAVRARIRSLISRITESTASLPCQLIWIAVISIGTMPPSSRMRRRSSMGIGPSQENTIRWRASIASRSSGTTKSAVLRPMS